MAVFPLQENIRREGYRERPPNNLKRSRMDRGPDKVRKYTNANSRPCTFTVYVDKVAANVLYDFYMDELSGGAFEFDFTSLLTDVTYKARFSEEPDFAAQETMWNIPISLELLA